MGNWQLEVFKLGIYVTFPVGVFYLFNQPSLFESWVVKMKRELYPPEHLTGGKEIKALVKEMREKHQTEMIRQMEEEISQINSHQQKQQSASK